jgi:molybdate transport system substrate-binding protein
MIRAGRARTFRAAVAATAVLLAAATPASATEPLRVSAAASLTDALGEIARLWERDGEAVELNFGASSALARQIEAGAPVDVFVSADPVQMDALERAGALLPGSRRALLGNSLAVIVPDDAEFVPKEAADLADPRIRRLALADPAAVPAGVYARRWLDSLGLWGDLARRVVPLENVRAALAAVDSGNAEAGVVFATDLAAARRSRLAFRVPASEAPPILYPAAAVRGRPDPARALRFLDHLTGAAARRVFDRHGFALPPAEEPPSAPAPSPR